MADKPLTDADLANLQQLEREMPPAPWAVEKNRVLREEGFAVMCRNTLPRLVDELVRARALLKRIEWEGSDSYGAEAECPECHGPKPWSDDTKLHGGHFADCELYALLGR